MAVAPKKKLAALFADKAAIRRAVEEQNALTGFVKDPDATPQKAREMMRKLGIRPEENVFSRGIIAARDEE